jgi:hypothetical protein
VLSTILLVVAGCDESLEFSNTPPGSITITKNLCYLCVEDDLGLSGTANDADGDSTFFQWSSQDGSFYPADGRGESVIWIAPAEPGTYRVTLTVSDGIDEGRKGIDIEVGPKVEEISGDVVLDRTDYPYFIDNITPIQVGLNESLRIMPGVTIIVNNNYGGLYVSGDLLIEGEAGNGVVIKSNVCPGGTQFWGGITIDGPAATCDMDNVEILMARVGVTVSGGAHADLNEVVVTEGGSEACRIEAGSSATITSCRFWDNGGGIWVEDGIVDISDVSIRYNSGYGLFFGSITADGQLDAAITGSVIALNYGGGFILTQYASPVINGNSIFLNGPDGGDICALKFQDYVGPGPIDATGNYWGVDTEGEIPGQICGGPAVDFSGWLADPPVSD